VPDPLIGDVIPTLAEAGLARTPASCLKVSLRNGGYHGSLCRQS
jgi:hypothetical protein